MCAWDPVEKLRVSLLYRAGRGRVLHAYFERVLAFSAGTLARLPL